MIPESKIIEFLLIFGVFIFILINYSRIKEIPNFNILMIAFLFLLLNNGFSVLEELFWDDLLNFLQHFCLTISSIFLTIWCFKIFTDKRKNNGYNNNH